MRRLGVALAVLLLVLAGCTRPPSPVPPRPSVPEPVPDHGPPASGNLKRVMISWDVYVRDANGVEGSVATDIAILLLTCTMTGNARVKDPAGRYVLFPWGDTVKIPYDFVIYVEPGAVLLLRCSGTLLQVQPAWRFECKSYVDQTVVDQNSDVVTRDRLVRSISCLVSGVG